MPRHPTEAVGGRAELHGVPQRHLHAHSVTCVYLGHSRDQLVQHAGSDAENLGIRLASELEPDLRGDGRRVVPRKQRRDDVLACHLEHMPVPLELVRPTPAGVAQRQEFGSRAGYARRERVALIVRQDVGGEMPRLPVYTVRVDDEELVRGTRMLRPPSNTSCVHGATSRFEEDGEQYRTGLHVSSYMDGTFFQSRESESEAR